VGVDEGEQRGAVADQREPAGDDDPRTGGGGDGNGLAADDARGAGQQDTHGGTPLQRVAGRVAPIGGDGIGASLHLASGQREGTREVAVTYVDVNGLPTWHEVLGEGRPVVLLHGGFAGASSWSAQAPALARAGFRVHVPERRGHAHTPDVEGPLSYEVMADDTVAYLDRVVGGPAHLVGWSDGAVVALLAARGRPDLVDRLVLIGQYYNASGRVAGSLVDQLRAGGDEVMGFLRAEYDQVSPDGPDHFPVVYAKTMRMLATEPALDLASLAAVAAPTLVLQGDRDEVTLEHGAAVAAALPQGRLAVLPGTHALPVENPEVVNTLLVWFLAGAVPAVDWFAPGPGR
jgi:pimeloyl-ACP methyl ester carboxylesterase